MNNTLHNNNFIAYNKCNNIQNIYHKILHNLKMFNYNNNHNNKSENLE